MSESLSGQFKLNDNVSVFLCILVIISSLVMAYTPKEYVFLRSIFFGFSMIYIGIMISQHAKIWIKKSDSSNTPKEDASQ